MNTFLAMFVYLFALLIGIAHLVPRASRACYAVLVLISLIAVIYTLAEAV
jgi:hypothetical protein